MKKNQHNLRLVYVELSPFNSEGKTPLLYVFTYHIRVDLNNIHSHEFLSLICRPSIQTQDNYVSVRCQQAKAGEK